MSIPLAIVRPFAKSPCRPAPSDTEAIERDVTFLLISLPFSLSSSDGEVRAFRPVVHRGPVRGELIGDDCRGVDVEEKASQQPWRRVRVAMLVDQGVENIAFVVDG